MEIWPTHFNGAPSQRERVGKDDDFEGAHLHPRENSLTAEDIISTVLCNVNYGAISLRTELARSRSWFTLHKLRLPHGEHTMVYSHV